MKTVGSGMVTCVIKKQVLYFENLFELRGEGFSKRGFFRVGESGELLGCKVLVVIYLLAEELLRTTHFLSAVIGGW